MSTQGEEYSGVKEAHVNEGRDGRSQTIDYILVKFKNVRLVSLIPSLILDLKY